MLQFNRKGLLTPSTNIKSDVEEFEQTFVIAFDSEYRQDLYKKYLIYSNGLKKALNNVDLIQWVDGSFVTKKANPSDIDMVTFIDAKSVEAVGIIIDDFKYPLSIEKYAIDAYIVKVYEKDDENFSLYIGDKMYWMDNFNKTRRNKNGQKHPKGFLEIMY